MNKLIYFFVLLFITSCAEKVPDMPKPSNLIPKEKMVVILAEVMELEGRAQTKYVQISKYGKPLEKEVDSLLISKGYSTVIFEQNMDYYGSRQDEMITIYEEVKQKLIAERKIIEKEELEAKKVK